MLESETVLSMDAGVIIHVPNHVDLNDAFENKQKKEKSLLKCGMYIVSCSGYAYVLSLP